jgi:amino acid transporter
MFAFTASGETASGAYGLQALIGVDLPIELYIVVCSVLAAFLNLLGIRATACVTGVLVVLMLAIRWYFGISGFLDPSWSIHNLISIKDAGWFSDNGIITNGLVLAIWSFVGIEFACSLASDVKKPSRAMPWGIILGLLAILATTLIMGIGISGAKHYSTWQAIAAGEVGAGGEAPQLAVGHVMGGVFGIKMMALASFLATLGTLTVAYASMPRILWRLAQDGRLPVAGNRLLARQHPKTKAPVAAILVTLAVYLIPSLYNVAVIDWLYSAAYVWLILYVVFHALALFNEMKKPNRKIGVTVVCSIVGMVSTTISIRFAFSGSHIQYGSRALVIIGCALFVTLLSAAPRLAWSIRQAPKWLTAEKLPAN